MLVRKRFEDAEPYNHEQQGPKRFSALEGEPVNRVGTVQPHIEKKEYEALVAGESNNATR